MNDEINSDSVFKAIQTLNIELLKYNFKIKNIKILRVQNETQFDLQECEKIVYPDGSIEIIC